jgi:hypothetical protein
MASLARYGSGRRLRGSSSSGITARDGVPAGEGVAARADRYERYGNVTNRSARLGVFAASLKNGCTAKISCVVRSIELCV